MAQFEKMYFKLFNAVTTALRLLEKNEAAAAIEVLKHTQMICEEIYIDDVENKIEQACLCEQIIYC